MKSTWKGGIREPLYAADAPRQTVSLTINSDLFARIKALGLNASRIAEEALARELGQQRRAKILVEVEADVRAVAEFTRRVGKYGDHAEMIRQHFEEEEQDKGGSGD